MNKTNFQHAAIAAAIQCLVTAGLLLAGPLCITACIAGALPGCFLFFGREHAQHERLLRKLPGMTEWAAVGGALNIFLWDVDSQLDFLAPVVFAVFQAILWMLAVMALM